MFHQGNVFVDVFFLIMVILELTKTQLYSIGEIMTSVKYCG